METVAHSRRTVGVVESAQKRLTRCAIAEEILPSAQGPFLFAHWLGEKIVDPREQAPAWHQVPGNEVPLAGLGDRMEAQPIKLRVGMLAHVRQNGRRKI